MRMVTGSGSSLIQLKSVQNVSNDILLRFGSLLQKINEAESQKIDHGDINHDTVKWHSV